MIARCIVSSNQQSKLTHPLTRRALTTVSVSQGFTIVEIFVAILITMISLSVALQMFITATYLRSKSGQLGNIHNWIQTDFEIVKSKAESFEIDVIPYSSHCGASLDRHLAATFISDSTNGLGGASANLGTKGFAGKDFTLTRTADYASTADPKSLISLTYALTSVAGGNPEFKMSAEVAVYAAFQCPN